MRACDKMSRASFHVEKIRILADLSDCVMLTSLLMMASNCSDSLYIYRWGGKGKLG